jgi:hypothetical protein
MLNNPYIFCFLVVFPLVSFAQQSRTTGLRDNLYIDNISYEVYPSSLKLKAAYNNISEAKNHSPIEVLKSILSENTIEWKLYNRGKTIQNTKITKADTAFIEDKLIHNYKKWAFMEPIMSVYYKQENIPHCIIKFYFGNDSLNLKLAIEENLIYQNNHWIRGVKSFQDFGSTLEKLHPNVIVALINGKSQKNKLLNQLIENTRNIKGGLDETKLKNIVTNWSEKSPEWQEFVQPYCFINQTPQKIIPSIETKSFDIAMPSLTKSKQVKENWVSSINNEKKIDKQLYTLLNEAINSKSLIQFQSLFIENPPKEIPVFFQQTKLENIQIVNSFYTFGSTTKDFSGISFWRLQDITSGKTIFIKTTERNEEFEMADGNPLSFTNSKDFEYLEWLFKNLEPEVFHETISYHHVDYPPYNTYTFKEIENEIMLCTFNQGGSTAINIDCLYLYFKKLRNNRKYNYLFVP